MIGRTVLVLSASLAAGVMAASSGWAAPAAAPALANAVASQYQAATFWGHPYPYGYAYARSQCWRRVQVETAYGWQWKRIWVCR